MTEPTSAETSGDGMRGSQTNTGNKLQAKSVLTKIAALVADRNIPFLVCSIGMIVMLLWAGKFKMTAPGAEGIIPLVSNSPLTSWQFKVFGPYILGDMIGLTEWTAAILLIVGYFKPKAGILGGIILVGMFFTTSSMFARLWEPRRLVRPFETLGTTTSRQTFRNSGNRTPYRPKKGFWVMFLSIEKGSGPWDRSLLVRNPAKEPRMLSQPSPILSHCLAAHSAFHEQLK